MVNEQNLVIEMIRLFPELITAYETEVAAWDGEKQPSNYDVVGFVFKPRFKAELEKGIVTDFLRRSAQFIESVCESGDVDALNVIWIKLFEWLLMHPPALRLLWQEFGPATRATVRDAASRWGSLAVLPE